MMTGNRLNPSKIAITVAFLIIGPLLIAFVGYKELKGKIQLTAPLSTPLIEDRQGQFITEGNSSYQQDLGFWEIKGELPERMKQALLVIEDRRFYKHQGVDLRALFRASWYTLTHDTRQGASTLAMQIIRMQNPGERTYWHKLWEMIAALGLIHKYGYDAVLRHYLKIAPQGNRIHGVSYAARKYFQKPLSDLSWSEAAVLASLPKAPGSMNVYNYYGFQKALTRANLILELLKQHKFLNQEEYQASTRELKNLPMPVKIAQPYHSYHAIIKMKQALQQLPGFAYAQPLHSGMDLRIQSEIDTLASATIRQLRLQGAGNVSVIVTEKATGLIVGYLGSEFYYDDWYAGAIDYASVPRSSGSTLKPFIYALGLEGKYFTPSSILTDLPLTIHYSGGNYSVRNFDEKYLGPVIYRKALANSRNVPAVQILRAIGLEETYQLFDRLGLIKDSKPADYYGLGMAIGGLYVTLEDLVRAYGVLANEGMSFNQHWFVKDSNASRTRLLSEETTRQISLFLSDPQARLPSFPRKTMLEYPFPVAVKTGTSQGFRDAWTLAYSSRYIVGAWIGHHNNEPMKHVSGIDTARLVKQILVFLHPEESRGIHETPFPPPQGYESVKLCGLNGQPATEACPEVFLEYFLPDLAPKKKGEFQQKIVVDQRTGTVPTTETPSKQVALKNYVELPAQFYEWGTQQGYNVSALLDSPWKTYVKIQEPVHQSVFIIDPDTPQALQTLALRAETMPLVSEIIWKVDGRLFGRAYYPYTLRWPLSPGEHTFQAHFPHANVVSEAVTITVSK
ncbi:transglycosylase domain-containing protein [Deltaproteobacteria bacterium TL4]